MWIAECFTLSGVVEQHFVMWRLIFVRQSKIHLIGFLSYIQIVQIVGRSSHPAGDEKS